MAKRAPHQKHEIIEYGLEMNPPPQKELKVIPSTGLYRDADKFIKEAVNTLMTARKDLRVSIACELYKREEISLGKACESAS